jgi:O-antigen ligase
MKWGLVALVLLAPLPFGAVTAAGRLALEVGAAVLALLWTADAALHGTALPPLPVRIGVAGMLALAMLQALPLGTTVVGLASPNAIEVRRAAFPPSEVLAAEDEILQRDARSLEAAPALSLEPERTASALRTGAVFAIVLLVTTSVTRTFGAGALATALLVSAAFQALYGILVLASGHDMIWMWPKEYYLDSATGTFVNKNHFAGFLEGALPCGLALIVSEWRRQDRRRGESLRERLVEMFGRDGIRSLFLTVLLIIGIAGLWLSLSRAGTALGLGALIMANVAVGKRGLRTRLVVAALLVAVAAVPLLQLGADRLTVRYSQTAEDLAVSGGRMAIWRGAAEMGADFPVFGAGFGTFAATYPLYRSPDVRRFFSHAHNDLLQVFAEGGAVGLLLLGLILGPVATRVVRAFTGSEGTLAIGFAAGLVAVMLHALVDFNFHIPSNGAVAAVLAGALLGLPWPPRS